MAVEDFGGTVIGKEIVIVSADHQNKSDIGTTRVREWIDKDAVDAVADVPGSAVGLAVSALIADKNKVSSQPALSTALTGAGCTPNTATHKHVIQAAPRCCPTAS
jgi:branched-chain amino acid transport system substrate-binding protein